MKMADKLSPAERAMREALTALQPFAAACSGYESFDGQHDFLDTDEIELGYTKTTVGALRDARHASVLLKIALGIK